MDSGARTLAPCGSLWQPVAALGPEPWRPEATCGSLLRPSRSPIEEDKMLRSHDSSILAPEILDSSCLGAWKPRAPRRRRGPIAVRAPPSASAPRTDPGPRPHFMIRHLLEVFGFSQSTYF